MLFNLIRFKDINDSILSSTESTDSPWHYLAIENFKILPRRYFYRSKNLKCLLLDNS